MILGTDWGAYLGYGRKIQIPFSILREKIGLSFFICKGDQEDPDNGFSTQLNLDAARKAGIPLVGCYYWHNPNYSPAFQLNRYIMAAELEQPDFIAVDIEQWDTGDGVTRVSPQRISDTAQALCEGLRGAFPQKQVIIYTRAQFVTEYSPPMAKWLPAFNGGWVAAWPDWGLTIYQQPWADIADLKMHRILDYDTKAWDVIDLHDGYQPDNLDAWTTWSIWQYSSRIWLPTGLEQQFYHQYDWNVFPGTVEEMLAWAKKETGGKMANIYNPSVAIKDRSRWVRMSSDLYKSVDATVWDQVDGALILMGGQDKRDAEKKAILYGDSAFQIWQAQAKAKGKRVGAIYAISADWYKWMNIDPSVVDRWKLWDDPAKNEHGDLVLAHLLSLWHKAPIGDLKTTLAAEKGDPSKWWAVDAIELQHVETTYVGTGGAIESSWQALVFDSLAGHLKTLMDLGLVPNVPILLYTYPAFLKASVHLMNSVTSKRAWLKLDYANWAQAPGNAIDARTFANFWAARIPTDWAFGTVPTYVENGTEYTMASSIWFWEWTAGLFRLPEFHTRENNVTVDAKVTAVAFCDTPASLETYMPAGIIVPPQPPPPSPGEVTLKDVYAKLVEVSSTVERSAAQLAVIADWLGGFRG